MSKIMIASDIHGSAFWCEKLMKAFEESGADRLLLLGDLLYHGPRNELPDGYAPKEVFAMLNGIKDRILAVRGNCDAEVDQMVLEFPIMADFAWLSPDGVRIFATHGHVYNDTEPGKMPLLSDGDALLFGHIHLPVTEKKETEDGKTYFLLNPGSVSLPKDGNPHSYAVLENRVFRIMDFCGGVVKEISL